jgi:hypothetical protein
METMHNVTLAAVWILQRLPCINGIAGPQEAQLHADIDTIKQ